MRRHDAAVDAAMRTLTWDGDNWTTTIALPAWKAHLSPRLVKRVPVMFNPEGAEEEVEPTAAQLAAVQRVVDRQVDLLAAVTSALRRHYTKERPGMLKTAADLPLYFRNFARKMPPAPSAATFAKLHRLHQIYVQPTSAKKLAHVGFGFQASWEVEHGIGVLTHGLRVREVGDEDTVILEWVAEEDAKKLRRAAKKTKPSAAPARARRR